MTSRAGLTAATRRVGCYFWSEGWFDGVCIWPYTVDSVVGRIEMSWNNQMVLVGG